MTIEGTDNSGGKYARRLNVGCGAVAHSEWCNVDLAPSAPGVHRHDVRRGLPWGDRSFDVVYHCHVLEHLPLTEAKTFLRECHRVLRPGGILRVVVPDLEGIARAYLNALDRVHAGKPSAEAEHAWMTIELLDQMTRTASGGEMLKCLQRTDLSIRDFIRTRIGADAECVGPSDATRAPSFWGRLRRAGWCGVLQRIRQLATLRMVRWLGGADLHRSCVEAVFRQLGETHRWMYDRISLAGSLREAGFVDVRDRSAFESEIPGFSRYGLDVVEGRVRKPDSLYVEARRRLE